MTRNHAFLAVGFAFIVLGVLAMVGCSSGCTIHGGNWDFATTTSKDGVELPHRATLHLSSAEKPARIVLDLEMAAIVVTGDASVTGIEADYEVNEKTPGDASLAAAADGVLVKSASGSPVLVTSAKLRVPPGTQVNVATALGDVRVSGVRGVPEVSAKTSAGSVQLRDLADVPKVTGHTDLGDVSLVKGATLGDVTLTTNAGSVSAKDVAGAKAVTIRSDLGDASADSVTASDSMTIETNAGSASASGVTTGRARLHSDLGDVTAKRSTFDHLVAHTNLGDVRLKACKYKTKDVGTDLGDVKEDE
jgi:DUF4097 and DUF4098 domain-containing protein YvlB